MAPLGRFEPRRHRRPRHLKRRRRLSTEAWWVIWVSALIITLAVIALVSFISPNQYTREKAEKTCVETAAALNLGEVDLNDISSTLIYTRGSKFSVGGSYEQYRVTSDHWTCTATPDGDGEYRASVDPD